MEERIFSRQSIHSSILPSFFLQRRAPPVDRPERLQRHELPTADTIATKLNHLGYFPTKVANVHYLYSGAREGTTRLKWPPE